MSKTRSKDAIESVEFNKKGLKYQTKRILKRKKDVENWREIFKRSVSRAKEKLKKKTRRFSNSNIPPHFENGYRLNKKCKPSHRKTYSISSQNVDVQQKSFNHKLKSRVAHLCSPKRLASKKYRKKIAKHRRNPSLLKKKHKSNLRVRVDLSTYVKKISINKKLLFSLKISKTFFKEENLKKKFDQKSIGAITDYRFIGQTLGEGANAVVRPAVNTLSGKLYAIKTYNKVKLSNLSQLSTVEKEIKIISKLRHKNLIRFIDRFENRRNIHLVMEYAGKKNLRKILNHQKMTSNHSQKNLKKILEIFKQIVQGVAHIHKIGITHRDLKLENIVINEETGRAKLVDFGYAKFETGKMTSVVCGTPNYMAPELQRRMAHYSKPVDVWALGVILFYLLFESFPFKGKNEIELSNAVNECQYDLDLVRKKFDGVFENIFEMIFQKEPELRVSAQGMLVMLDKIEG